ncbi:MAG: CHAD domain-containing protein [Alphaproteobacteria bacterium]|nr:CHAD domain-containing protein [Alphaproteobacteria bacterium]
MSEEIELKLEIAEAAIPAVLKSEALRRRRVRFRPARHLVTTYFDTAKGALRRKGVFLRLREDGARITQTVKTAGEAGIVAQRGEWNWPLKTAEPDLELASECGLKPILKRARKGGLKPVFASDLSRRVARVQEAGAELELALDVGHVRAGRRSTKLAELEIEVKQGTAAAVFGLARELVVLPGVRIGMATKASRGFALAEGRHPAAAVKAAGVAVSERLTVGEAEAAIIRTCAAQIAANVPAVVDRRLPEGVHQMRVALRRLRAALSLFKDTMPPEARRALRRQAGTLARALGPARDLDVLMADTIRAAAPPEALAADIRALTLRLGRARREAWKTALAAVSGPEIGLLVLDLSERAAALEAEGWPGQHDAIPLPEMAVKALDDRHEIVLALGQSIDTLPVLQRHELRLALKKLRYAADFFAGLFPHKAAKAGIAALAALQDDLGGFNDAASTSAILDAAVAATPEKGRAPVERAALFLKGWASLRADLAWGHARQSWAAFAGKKPFWR